MSEAWNASGTGWNVDVVPVDNSCRPTCRTCRYWDHSLMAAEDAYGVCRRYPLRKTDKYVETHETVDWCGEWKRPKK